MFLQGEGVRSHPFCTPPPIALLKKKIYPPFICCVHVIDRLKIQFNDLPPST